MDGTANANIKNVNDFLSNIFNSLNKNYQNSSIRRNITQRASCPRREQEGAFRGAGSIVMQ